MPRTQYRARRPVLIVAPLAGIVAGSVAVIVFASLVALVVSLLDISWADPFPFGLMLTFSTFGLSYAAPAIGTMSLVLTAFVFRGRDRRFERRLVIAPSAELWVWLIVLFLPAVTVLPFSLPFDSLEDAVASVSGAYAFLFFPSIICASIARPIFAFLSSRKVYAEEAGPMGRSVQSLSP